MKTNVRYDIAMNSFIIILNIAAILYMKINKIPSDEVDDSLLVLFISYFLFGLGSCMCWIMGITELILCEVAYVFGRIW